MTSLLTIGDIARRIGVPRSRLDYAVDKAGIRERSRAGILRLFSSDQIPVMEVALRAVRSRRPKTEEAEEGGSHVHAES